MVDFPLPRLIYRRVFVYSNFKAHVTNVKMYFQVSPENEWAKHLFAYPGVPYNPLLFCSALSLLALSNFGIPYIFRHMQISHYCFFIYIYIYKYMYIHIYYEDYTYISDYYLISHNNIYIYIFYSTIHLHWIHVLTVTPPHRSREPQLPFPIVSLLPWPSVSLAILARISGRTAWPPQQNDVKWSYCSITGNFLWGYSQKLSPLLGSC